jgi:hypothetical protein
VPAPLLGIPTLLGAWTGDVLRGLPRLPLAVGFHLVATAYLGLAITAILRAVHREGRVSADSI